jgi:hypothetical protein
MEWTSGQIVRTIEFGHRFDKLFVPVQARIQGGGRGSPPRQPYQNVLYLICYTIKLHYFVLYHSNVLLIVIVTNFHLLFL